MGTVSKIVAVCLSALVLVGGVGLGAAAGGGHSGGDSGKYQYGTKPSCKHPTKKRGYGHKARKFDSRSKYCARPPKPRYNRR